MHHAARMAHLFENTLHFSNCIQITNIVAGACPHCNSFLAVCSEVLCELFQVAQGEPSFILARPNDHQTQQRFVTRCVA